MAGVFLGLFHNLQKSHILKSILKAALKLQSYAKYLEQTREIQ